MTTPSFSGEGHAAHLAADRLAPAVHGVRASSAEPSSPFRQARSIGLAAARRAGRCRGSRRCLPSTSSARRPHSSSASAFQTWTRSSRSSTTTPRAGSSRIDSRNALTSFSSSRPLAELVVDRLELLVRRLELLVHRLELLVGRLELLVGRLELLVRRLQLLVGRLELLVGRLELLVGRLELAARRARARRWSRRSRSRR